MQKGFEALRIRHTVDFDDDSKRFVNGQTIDCATCGKHQTITVNNRSSRFPPEVLERKFKALGWDFLHGGWRCPDHSHKKTIEAAPAVPSILVLDKPAPPPAKEKPVAQQDKNIVHLDQLGAATIAKMSASDHRRIFRKIDENWDDSRGRYVADWGDNKVAVALDVPRAWVEHVRKEAFGEAGGSEEIEELSGELLAAEKRIKTYAEQALAIATKFDDEVRAVQRLRQQLDRIKVATGVR